MEVSVPSRTSWEIYFFIQGLPFSHSLAGPTSARVHLSGLAGMSATLAGGGGVDMVDVVERGATPNLDTSSPVLQSQSVLQ